jgi:F-type H+-transporting ATPase subunit gamma
MANARAIVKRRKAVKNTRKITRTMQLIATARYQQALQRAVGTRPYTEKIRELVAQLTGTVEAVDDPLLRTEPVANRDAVLVLTSDRGFCGGYNANLLRKAVEQSEATAEPGRETDLHVVGKKGIAFFGFMGRELASQTIDIDHRPRFEDVAAMADGFLDQFRNEKIDALYVVYMRFISVGRQVPEVTTLLPLQPVETSDDDQATGASTERQYEFTPDPAVLLAELLPQTVKVQLFQCFNDAAVSEQVARMVAMKAATDAAGDMIKSLSQQYNRARQTQITMELLDIMGGAEAIK